jgi:glycosyltransferase involved in cell wall biosynthesis
MMWTCCQLGAREHYAVPRALQLNGLLSEFITDVWIRRAGRFHPDLAAAQVTAPNVAALTFELKAYATRATGWKLITERNDWFQRRAVDQLKLLPANGTHTLFAYSYAAEQIFAFARERGWRTVLGQIDPGPAEERMLADLHKGGQNGWKPAPPAYWSQWRSECSLADEIIVNSAWSKDALLSEGIAPEKIRVIPLAYEPSAESGSFQRHYPDAFTHERPLRVLFLGQINLRKGVGHLFDAVKLLEREAIEFWFVGPRQIEIPAELKDNPRVRWFGVVPRSHVDSYYKLADVFMFPTLSDGFGLTQLEAQSWKLPVIASRQCGEVVNDGVNGKLLDNVSPQMIADLLHDFLKSPKSLEALSAQSGIDPRFSLEALASSLTDKCNR